MTSGNVPVERAPTRDRAPNARALGWPTLLALLAAALMGWAAAIGVDFGWHWDEVHQFTALRGALRRHSLLPGFYAYPSVTFTLTALAHVPEFIRAAGQTPAGGDVWASLAAVAGTPSAWLRARTLFALLASTTPLWVFAATRRLRGSAVEASFAALLVASSWQVGYHARWVAPDALLMTAAALTQWFALVAATEGPTARGTRAAMVSSVLAGVAASCKYPGAILVVSSFLAVHATLPSSASHGQRQAAFARSAALAAAAYLVLTPATILDARNLFTQVAEQARIYREGHGQQHVDPGPAHAARAAEYVLLHLLSVWRPVGAGIAALAFAGGWSLRRERPVLLVLVTAPALYFVYMTSQRLLNVRNLLLFAPCLSVLAGRGLGWATDSLRSPIARRAVLGACALVVLGQSADLVAAARSIPSTQGDAVARAKAESVASLCAWMASDAPGEVAVSPGLSGGLAALACTAPAARDPQSAHHVALWTSEMVPPQLRPANDPRNVTAVFGPREVDWIWYAGWVGLDRVVVVPIARIGGFVPRPSPARSPGAAVPQTP